VLALGVLLLDDRSLHWLLPQRVREALPLTAPSITVPPDSELLSMSESPVANSEELPARVRDGADWIHATGVVLSGVMLTWIAYVTTVEMIHMPWPDLPLPSLPVTALEPFRIANQYGLFAVMTRQRYEIEFQGSNDDQDWKPYPFRFKPQALDKAPGIYAPYQPRFEWNLWFASLGEWQQNDFVPLTEERLLENDPYVLALFRSNPFGQTPPRYVRAVLWQYWFTSMEEKRRTGNWWKREFLGLYAPELTRQPGGKFAAVAWPAKLPAHD
jgi:lipase maturation factor 1